MKRYDKLIFISNSDTALGPMAEAILKSKYLLEELEVTSKGNVVLFPEPINPKTEAVLVSNGLTMKEHMSDPISAEDFNDRTLVLAVNKTVYQKLSQEYADRADQLFVLNEYVKEEKEIIDPYGGTLADYGQCYEELDRLISRLVVQLNEDELLR